MTAHSDNFADLPPISQTVPAPALPVYVLPETPGAGPRRRRADNEHDLFATIVEDAFSEILVFDPQTLTLLLCNRSARNNLGYGPAEILALKITDLAVEFTADQIRAIHQPLLDGADARTVAYMSYRRKGGTAYPVEVHSRASTFGGRRVIFQIVIDQTELKREQARADLVSSIERDATESADSSAFLEQVLMRLCRHFACQIATVHFWKRDTLVPSGLWHVERPANWQEPFRKATEMLKTPSGQGLAGRAHARRRPVMSNNPAKDPNLQRRIGPGPLPISHGFALPVLVGGEAAAVLELYSAQPISADIWANLAQLIGEQVSRLYERKCIEDGANESRARFDAAVNGANVGLWDYNYKSGLFFLSQRCKEILHIPEDAAPPGWKSFGANIHPDDIRHAAMAMKAHVIRRTPYDVEYRYQLSDGRYIWLHARAQGVWDDQGGIIRTAGTIADISAEKESESVQREVLACIAASDDAEIKIVEALDRVGLYLKLDAAIVSHVTDDRFEVQYRSSSGAGPELHSIMPLADTLCSDIYSGDAVQAFADLNLSPLAEHRARQQQCLGAYIGTPIFVRGLRFGTLSFQSARSRAPFTAQEIDMVRLLARWIGEEIGRASHLARLMEDDMHKTAKLACTADALLTIDQAGRIEDANQVACDMFLMDADELRGTMIGELLPTAQTFSHPDGRLISLSQRQDVALRKDGQRISVLLNIAEMPMGERTIYTLALSDLTDVKQAETAKREFVSVVSHELRTPLTSIRGALSLIVNETTGPLTPEAAKLAVIAQRNCERLLRLVNDILDMEKLETGKFEISLHPIDLAEWLPDVVAAHAAYAARFDTAFDLALEPGLAAVIADRDRLMQVMANLLSNAAKFTRPGTRVLVSAADQGKHVRIAVRDQGNGVAENIRGRIFEKFTQGQSANTREREGSGLGLSIARQMILLMNGDIGFVSEAEGGTTFYVDLPAVERRVPAEEMEWAAGPVRARLAQQMLSRRAWETMT